MVVPLKRVAQEQSRPLSFPWGHVGISNAGQGDYNLRGPFLKRAGRKRIAMGVIDFRGNEVMRVIKLNDAVWFERRQVRWNSSGLL